MELIKSNKTMKDKSKKNPNKTESEKKGQLKKNTPVKNRN